MIGLPEPVRIYLHPPPSTMRKSFERLKRIGPVGPLQQDP